MKVRYVTEREIDPRDIDAWISVWRIVSQGRLVPQTFKRERIATWTDDVPEMRTRAVTTIMIVDGEA